MVTKYTKKQFDRFCRSAKKSFKKGDLVVVFGKDSPMHNLPLFELATIITKYSGGTKFELKSSKGLYQTVNITNFEHFDTNKVSDVEVEGIDHSDHPDYCDAFVAAAMYRNHPMSDEMLLYMEENYSDFVYECISEQAQYP